MVNLAPALRNMPQLMERLGLGSPSVVESLGTQASKYGDVPILSKATYAPKYTPKELPTQTNMRRDPGWEGVIRELQDLEQTPGFASQSARNQLDDQLRLIAQNVSEGSLAPSDELISAVLEAAKRTRKITPERQGEMFDEFGVDELDVGNLHRSLWEQVEGEFPAMDYRSQDARPQMIQGLDQADPASVRPGMGELDLSPAERARLRYEGDVSVRGDPKDLTSATAMSNLFNQLTGQMTNIPSGVAPSLVHPSGKTVMRGVSDITNRLVRVLGARPGEKAAKGDLSLGFKEGDIINPALDKEGYGRLFSSGRRVAGPPDYTLKQLDQANIQKALMGRIPEREAVALARSLEGRNVPDALLDVIAAGGVERYFKPTGKMKDNLVTLAGHERGQEMWQKASGARKRRKLESELSENEIQAREFSGVRSSDWQPTKQVMTAEGPKTVPASRSYTFGDELSEYPHSLIEGRRSRPRQPRDRGEPSDALTVTDRVEHGGVPSQVSRYRETAGTPAGTQTFRDQHGNPVELSYPAVPGKKEVVPSQHPLLEVDPRFDRTSSPLDDIVQIEEAIKRGTPKPKQVKEGAGEVGDLLDEISPDVTAKESRLGDTPSDYSRTVGGTAKSFYKHPAWQEPVKITKIDPKTGQKRVTEKRSARTQYDRETGEILEDDVFPSREFRQKAKGIRDMDVLGEQDIEDMARISGLIARSEQILGDPKITPSRTKKVQDYMEGQKGEVRSRVQEKGVLVDRMRTNIKEADTRLKEWHPKNIKKLGQETAKPEYDVATPRGTDLTPDSPYMKEYTRWFTEQVNKVKSAEALFNTARTKDDVVQMRKAAEQIDEFLEQKTPITDYSMNPDYKAVTRGEQDQIFAKTREKQLDLFGSKGAPGQTRQQQGLRDPQYQIEGDRGRIEGSGMIDELIDEVSTVPARREQRPTTPKAELRVDEPVRPHGTARAGESGVYQYAPTPGKKMGKQSPLKDILTPEEIRVAENAGATEELVKLFKSKGIKDDISREQFVELLDQVIKQ